MRRRKSCSPCFRRSIPCACLSLECCAWPRCQGKNRKQWEEAFTAERGGGFEDVDRREAAGGEAPVFSLYNGRLSVALGAVEKRPNESRWSFFTVRSRSYFSPSGEVLRGRPVIPLVRFPYEWFSIGSAYSIGSCSWSSSPFASVWHSTRKKMCFR
jgi:hypothetical protein